MSGARTRIFVSYSHADADWLKRLQIHLTPLGKGVAIEWWDDTRILPGMVWRYEIEKALAAADIVVLLVSADFLASDFIATDELPPLLAAAQDRGLTILSLIVGPSRFKRMPELSRFQAVNDPDRPLIGLSKVEQETVLLRLADKIRGFFSSKHVTTTLIKIPQPLIIASTHSVQSKYYPPQTLWEVSEKLKFDEPLDADDPRYVETDKARGDDFKLNSLLKQLGIDPNSLEFKAAHDRLYILFCGHRGCGKSTELRRVRDRLHDPQRFFVVFVDAIRYLDTNNLNYVDMLFALGRVLFERLAEAEISIDPISLKSFANWFRNKIGSNVELNEFASEIETEERMETEIGLYFFIKLFALATKSFKVNVTYKQELRQIFKNNFTEFSIVFNHLIAETEVELRAANKGRKLLFIVDGTDRMSKDDSERFFIKDIHQLQMINGLFVYCAPIHMVYENNQINQIFTSIIKLPMIKLCEQDGTKLEIGYKVMLDILYRRANRTLFDSETTARYLIEYSGGHPRDLLRLLNYAFSSADGEQFDEASAKKAVKQLAMDYRRILDTQDYLLLRMIDQLQCNENYRNSDQQRSLLYNLVLLEYDDYWWKSHPVVRTLPEYQTVGKP